MIALAPRYGSPDLWDADEGYGLRAGRARDDQRPARGLGLCEPFRPQALAAPGPPVLLLARALAVNPEILLMDEPFGSLDAQTRQLMQEELQRMVDWKRSGKIVIFVTHDIEEAVFLADKVFVFSFRPGKIMKEIEIPFPTPRSLEIKEDPTFLKIKHEIWSLLAGEARKAMVE